MMDALLTVALIALTASITVNAQTFEVSRSVAEIATWLILSVVLFGKMLGFFT